MTELNQLDFDSCIGVSAEPGYLFSFLEVLVLIVNFTPKLDVFTIHNFLADSDISPFHKSKFFTLNDIDRIIVLKRGAVVREFSNEQISKDRLLEAA